MKIRVRVGGEPLEECGNECAAETYSSYMALDETNICLAPGPAAPEHHPHARTASASSFLLLMLLWRNREPVPTGDVVQQWPRQRTRM